MIDDVEIIIKEFLDKIYKTCLGFVADETIASDLVQEVCINIWIGYKKFKHQSSISTWIYRITVNTCLMYKRKKRHSIIQLTEVENYTTPIECDEASTDQHFLLQKLVAALPEKDRVIIILYLENLTHAEIGEVVGISANYVGVKINRIKTKLTAQVNNI